MIRRITFDQRFHLIYLFNYRRHAEIAYHPDHKAYLDKSQHRSERPASEMIYTPVELYERIENIGNQTSETEWQKHIFKRVDQPYHAGKRDQAEKHTHYSVECERT